MQEAATTKLWTGLRSYRPLIVAVLVASLASYIWELIASGSSVLEHNLMNTFMGFFFIVFAAPKVLNVRGFSAAFQEYDIVGARLPAYAWSYPFIELLLGFVFLSGLPANSQTSNLFWNLLVVIITGIGAIGIAQALRQRRQVFCACLGSAFKLPLSKVSLFENIAMLAMASYMIIFYASFHEHVVSLLHIRL